MNYIINPAIFYWISVSDAIKAIALVGLIIFGIAAISGTVAYLIIAFDCEWDFEDEENAKRLRKIARNLIIIALICAVFVAVVPSKTTLIEMLIAKTATYENAEWTAESIKSVVDYIVEAFKAVNG